MTHSTRTPSYCAIDFGTSNSAVAVPDSTDGVHLVELEPGHSTMPTAVFYFSDGPEHDGPPRAYGRAAVAAYVDGLEGRLLRSMKSILGSGLAEQGTDVGGGRAVRYFDVVAGYLKRLKHLAETDRRGRPMERVVLGRPVHFVDDDPVRDAQAAATLASAARAAGFGDIAFQYEPIAAAFDYERSATSEELVLVADIGGGTSDFSLVRVGPERRRRVDRQDDILANHGVHVAGTDFDRQIELAGILGEFGFRSHGPVTNGAPPREVPSGIYFDLATWHLINTVYTPQRVAELRGMRGWYGDPAHHRRLMTVLTERLGHELAARAEGAKIDVADGADALIDLSLVEWGLRLPLAESEARRALEGDVERIVEAARRTVADAGVLPEAVSALYLTGGSTGLRVLADRLAGAFPAAPVVRGDRYASVATGLGLYARRLFAPAA